MEPLYGVNGLMFWTETEIKLRRMMADYFADAVRDALLTTNPAWRIMQIEAPLLTPRSLLSSSYTNSDIWVQEEDPSNLLPEFRQFMVRDDALAKLEPVFREYGEANHTGFGPQDTVDDLRRSFDYVRNYLLRDINTEPTSPRWSSMFEQWLTWRREEAGEIEATLALRPETTPGSYLYAQHLLKSHSGVKPPLCIWQAGKSFRREYDVTKNMRLKEFYQQEFQCLYTADTLNDYHAAMLDPVREMIADMVGLPTRLVESDRLPSYSQITMDVEVDNGEKWMECCSISRRTDFPEPVRFQTMRKGEAVTIAKDLLVLEIAIGLDRCVYNWTRARR